MICTRSHNTQAKTGENAAAVMTKGHERPEKKSPDRLSRAALMIEKAIASKAQKQQVPTATTKHIKNFFWEKGYTVMTLILPRLFPCSDKSCPQVVEESAIVRQSNFTRNFIYWGQRA